MAAILAFSAFSNNGSIFNGSAAAAGLVIEAKPRTRITTIDGIVVSQSLCQGICISLL
jgi:hypothetical protein